MKFFTRNFSIFIFFSILLLGFYSCTTNSTSSNPNFLGDFDPVQLGTISVYTTSFGSEKTNKIEVFFAPRTNLLHFYIKSSLNKMNIKLSESDRANLQEAITNFSANLVNDNLPNRKPTSKNAYSSSLISMEWGLTGAGHETNEAGIRYNYKYLSDNRPYFMIDLIPGDDSVMEGAMSPQTDIYISPSNLEELLEMTKQENLQAIVDELNSEYAY